MMLMQRNLCIVELSIKRVSFEVQTNRKMRFTYFEIAESMHCIHTSGGLFVRGLLCSRKACGVCHLENCMASIEIVD